MPKLFEGTKETPKIRGQIRDLFAELGGALPVRELAQEVINRKVLPDYKFNACMLRGVSEECKLALKEKTSDGMPFAKPIADEDETWKQLDLFNYEEFCGLIERTGRQVLADYRELVSYRDYCKKRFGRAPEIPQLLELEGAGA